MEESFTDTCAWCKHDLKVYVLSWQTVKSRTSYSIVANYCDEKTCREEGCAYGCAEIALSTPENTEKMLHEIVNRRNKLKRLQEEAEKRAKEEGSSRVKASGGT